MSILNRIIIPQLSNPYDTVIVAAPYAATGNIYVSFDKGTSWNTYSAIGSTNSMFFASVVKNSLLIGRYGASQSKPEYSNNLGVNLYQASLNQRIYPQCVMISEDGSFFGNVYGDAGYFSKSIDGGASWSQVSVFAKALGLAMNSDASLIYMSNTNDSKLAYSTDYGDTWTLTNDLYYPYALNCLDMSSNGNYIFVGVRTYGDRMIKSTDGGATWSSPILVGSRKTGPQAVNMSCSSSGQYVFFHTTALNYVSNDYGVNWTRVLSSYSTTYSYNKAVSHSGKYMAVGNHATNGSFFFSEDFGVSWSVKTISGLSVPIRAVVVNEWY